MKTHSQVLTRNIEHGIFKDVQDPTHKRVDLLRGLERAWTAWCFSVRYRGFAVPGGIGAPARFGAKSFGLVALALLFAILEQLEKNCEERELCELETPPLRSSEAQTEENTFDQHADARTPTEDLSAERGTGRTKGRRNRHSRPHTERPPVARASDASGVANSQSHRTAATNQENKERQPGRGRGRGRGPRRRGPPPDK
jgi:hypothetical protein